MKPIALKSLHLSSLPTSALAGPVGLVLSQQITWCFLLTDRFFDAAVKLLASLSMFQSTQPRPEDAT